MGRPFFMGFGLCARRRDLLRIALQQMHGDQFGNCESPFRDSTLPPEHLLS